MELHSFARYGIPKNWIFQQISASGKLGLPVNYDKIVRQMYTLCKRNQALKMVLNRKWRQSTAAIIIPFFYNFPVFCPFVGFPCLTFVTIIYVRFLLTEDTDVAALFEDTRGLKYVCFSRHVTRLSAAKRRWKVQFVFNGSGEDQGRRLVFLEDEVC
jgi:hypothetical protein